MHPSSPPQPDARGIALSVIMPYYKRFDSFRRVFPYNYPYLCNSGRPVDARYEVILSLDEDSELERVLGFVDGYPDINWKVVVNHQDHPWRPPSKAINVGLRHAVGDYILIGSPESMYVGDLPGRILEETRRGFRRAVAGRLGFCTFDDLARCESPQEALGLYLASAATTRFYGSICVSRRKAFQVGGFDECFTRWGGDDDNFRVRLRKSGWMVVKSAAVNILHMSDKYPVYTREEHWPGEYLDRIDHPPAARCPTCFPYWGRAFDPVVRDWSAEGR